MTSPTAGEETLKYNNGFDNEFATEAVRENFKLS